MGTKEYLKSEMDQHAEIFHRLIDLLPEALCEIVAVCTSAFRGGRKILLFGNGGSAADAQHIATEFTARFRIDRKALAAIALTTDTSALTAIGNDYGFECLFSRQVEALCVPGDIVIGLSTSGNSENVIRGLSAAKKIGAVTVALLGCDGGRIKGTVDHEITVPSNSTARIQEMHILIGHILCGAVEEEVGRA